MGLEHSFGRAKCNESPPTVAEKTKEQANAVSEAVVTSVNTVANKTVEEAENIVVSAGVVQKVRPGAQPSSQAQLTPPTDFWPVDCAWCFHTH